MTIFNALTHCATLLGYSFWKKKFIRFIKLILFFISIGNSSQYGGVLYTTLNHLKNKYLNGLYLRFLYYKYLTYVNQILKGYLLLISNLRQFLPGEIKPAAVWLLNMSGCLDIFAHQ